MCEYDWIRKSRKHKKIIKIIEEDKKEYGNLIETSQEKAYILHRLTILKQYQKLGIAKKLLHFAEELARKKAIKI